MEVIHTIPYSLIVTAIFFFGLVIGSFANVCVYRLPKKESVVFPVSRCVSCSATVRYFDNIPLISFLILGGKCRNCKENISLILAFILINQGCHGVAIFGSTGQSQLIAISEKINFLNIFTAYYDLRRLYRIYNKVQRVVW